MRNQRQTMRETWSDLPIDIFLSILSLLTLQEITCASVVCKRWYSYVISERVLTKPPLLLRFPREEGSILCEFYNPSTRDTKYLELPQLKGCLVFSWSVDGWLLSWKRRTGRPFFFNPYTEVSIDLPTLNLSDYGNFMVVFSSSPMHDDCTIFAVKCIYPDTVVISTCDIKTKEWKTKGERLTDDAFLGVLGNMIYSNGFLYCQSPNRYLFAYDTKTCEWTLDAVSPPRLPILFGINWLSQCKLAEHEGNIYLIFLYCVEEPIVYKLDKTNKLWEKVNKLGGVTLFVSQFSAQARVYVSGIEPNNIYFPYVRYYGQNCIRYSVDESRFYPNKKYSLPKEEHPFTSMWMDPPADDASLM